MPQLVVIMKEYIDVLPTNVNQVQSVSYRNGNPLVEFKIGAQDRYLLGSTIRINGQLSVTKAGGATNPADGDLIAMDPRLGVYACIDQLAGHLQLQDLANNRAYQEL